MKKTLFHSLIKRSTAFWLKDRKKKKKKTPREFLGVISRMLELCSVKNSLMKWISGFIKRIK